MPDYIKYPTVVVAALGMVNFETMAIKTEGIWEPLAYVVIASVLGSLALHNSRGKMEIFGRNFVLPAVLLVICIASKCSS